MNLPNKITVFRFFMIPIFVVVFLINTPATDIAALVIFVVASVSDFLDGYLARKNNMVTDFGKLMDPLADKMLVTSALVCFVALRPNFPSWCAIIVLLREFIITGFRQLAAEKNVIIQASMWGKSKTVVQLITCILYLLNWDYVWFGYAEVIFMCAATILTLISLIDYVIKNWKVIKLASK